jgi:hypothetical protein
MLLMRCRLLLWAPVYTGCSWCYVNTIVCIWHSCLQHILPPRCHFPYWYLGLTNCLPCCCAGRHVPSAVIVPHGNVAARSQPVTHGRGLDTQHMRQGALEAFHHHTTAAPPLWCSCQPQQPPCWAAGIMPHDSFPSHTPSRLVMEVLAVGSTQEMNDGKCQSVTAVLG